MTNRVLESLKTGFLGSPSKMVRRVFNGVEYLSCTNIYTFKLKALEEGTGPKRAGTVTM